MTGVRSAYLWRTSEDRAKRTANRDLADRANPADRRSKACGKSVSPGGWRFQYAWERPRHGPFADFPKGNAPYLPGGRRTRSGGGVGSTPRASSDDDKLLFRLRSYGTERFFTPMLQDHGNCFPEAREAFFAGCALTICSWNFSAIRDVPWAVLFHNCCEFVAHTRILPFLKRSRADKSA